MGLTMAQRKAVTRELAQRYRRTTRREKGEILDQWVQLTGHTRNHASWLLRCWGRTVYSYQGGRAVKIVVGTRRPRRHSPRYYNQEVYRALKQVWELFGGMCGKRLVAVLEKFGELSLEPQVRAKLQRISAATIDRLLRAEKRKLQLRGRSHTKPRTRLMHQIPIRTFTEWEDAKPGEVGADLVGHDGGHGGGEHAFTLVVTDRVTQWTELRAVLNKAQKWVFQALLWIRAVLPFLLHALHTDSGSEFINHHLTRYCLQPADPLHPLSTATQERQQLHRGAFCRNSGALMRKSGRENKRTDLSLRYFVGYAVRTSVAPHSTRIRSLMRRR